MDILPYLAVPAGAGLLLLAARTWSASVRRKDARAAYFRDAASLFDTATSRIEPSGFARMTGRRGSDAFDLQALADSLTFRKLPALWVMVTLPAPMPVRATLDIMARPGGAGDLLAFP